MDDDLINDVVLWMLSTSVNQMSQTAVGHHKEKYLSQDHNRDNFLWQRLGQGTILWQHCVALNHPFFFLHDVLTFAAHLTPAVRVDSVVFFPARLSFILKSLLMALNRSVIPSFKENDNCAELRLPKQFKFWMLAVAASFTFRFCGSFLSYSGSLSALKARLRLKLFPRSEVFRPNTQITVTWADEVADISMLLSSVLFASSRLCINEESQTAGRTFCVKSSLIPCLVHCQTKLRCCTALSTASALLPKALCIHAVSWQRSCESQDSWITLQCVRRKGWEHRCFCLSSSNTDSSPASVCLVLCRCPPQTFQTFCPAHVSE